MKLLTGKCKEDFEKWYEDPKRDYVGLRRKVQWFYTLSFLMQWGVIQEFADSKGINITLCQIDLQAWYGYQIVAPHLLDYSRYYRGVWRRDKAREKAIEHLNRMYNGN